MNDDCLRWLRNLKTRMPERFQGCDVLEVGSRDVNGSARQVFGDCRSYLGLDCHAGQGVDVVAMAAAHLVDVRDRFDIVLCLGTLEHDPEWRLTVPAMGQALRPGGLMLLSWAGPGYPEHGTTKNPRAGGFYGPDPDYYRNIDPAEMIQLFHNQDLWFDRRELHTLSRICYFAGIGKTAVDTEWPVVPGDIVQLLNEGAGVPPVIARGIGGSGSSFLLREPGE